MQNQRTHSHGEIPTQGSTIASDRMLSGCVVFADASRECNKIPGPTGIPATGIGVFIKNEAVGNQYSIMIQAATSLTSSVLAEAKALLLAAEITRLLNIDRPKLLTDNLTLAKVTASRQLVHPLVHWDTRDDLANLFMLNSRSSAQVFHIRRDLNGVAHNCAHQALRHCHKQPIFSCVNLAHQTGHCPVLSVLNSSLLQAM